VEEIRPELYLNLGVVVLSRNPSCLALEMQVIVRSQFGAKVSLRSYLRNIKSKRTENVAQVIESLPSNLEALSSIPYTTTKQTNKNLFQEE
jgi:hypothetical protein